MTHPSIERYNEVRERQNQQRDELLGLIRRAIRETARLAPESIARQDLEKALCVLVRTFSLFE